MVSTTLASQWRESSLEGQLRGRAKGDGDCTDFARFDD